MYLITHHPEGNRSLKVSETQEQKLTKLISTRQLPGTFALNGTRIVSETILGFSDKPVPVPNINSWEQLKLHVHQQPWYLKHREGSSLPPSHTPESSGVS